MSLARRDDLVLVVEFLDGGDRPEDFVAEKGRRVGDIDEHGRQIEEAPARRPAAAGHHARALADRIFDEMGDLVARLGIDERPDFDAVFEPVADPHRAHAPRQLCGERIMDARVDIEAIGGGAGLADIAHLGDHRAIDRGIDIGVGADDEGRIAAEFHRRRDDTVGGAVQQLAADFGRAGEGDHAHPPVVQEPVDERPRAPRGNDIDDAFRHAGLFEERRERQHGQRRLRCGLDDDGASGRERRADLARAHRRREVPGRDHDRDTGRPVLHENARAARRRPHHVADVAHGLFREPAEEFRGIGDLAAGIGERLAVLERHQPGEPILFGHDEFEGLAQDFRTRARRPGRPIGKGLRRGIESGEPVLGRRTRDRGDDVFGRRVDHIETAAIGRFARATVDPQAGRNIGEEIVCMG